MHLNAILMKVHEAYQDEFLSLSSDFYQELCDLVISDAIQLGQWLHHAPNIRLVGKRSQAWVNAPMHNTQHMQLHGTQFSPQQDAQISFTHSMLLGGISLFLSLCLSLFSLSLTLPLYLSVPFCHIEFSVSHPSEVELSCSLARMFSAWVQDRTVRNKRTYHFTFFAYSGL